MGIPTAILDPLRTLRGTASSFAHAPIRSFPGGEPLRAREGGEPPCVTGTQKRPCERGSDEDARSVRFGNPPPTEATARKAEADLRRRPVMAYRRLADCRVPGFY